MKLKKGDVVQYIAETWNYSGKSLFKNKIYTVIAIIKIDSEEEDGPRYLINVDTDTTDIGEIGWNPNEFVKVKLTRLEKLIYGVTK